MKSDTKVALKIEFSNIENFCGGFGICQFEMVGRARFELATNGLKVRCSTD